MKKLLKGTLIRNMKLSTHFYSSHKSSYTVFRMKRKTKVCLMLPMIVFCDQKTIKHIQNWKIMLFSYFTKKIKKITELWCKFHWLLG